MFQVSSQEATLFNFYRIDIYHKPKRMIRELSIDKSFSWGLFDRANQGLEKQFGMGGALYFLDQHFISFKENKGRVSINLVKLLALKKILKKSFDSGI
jgi:hypothetical protein